LQWPETLSPFTARNAVSVDYASSLPLDVETILVQNGSIRNSRMTVFTVTKNDQNKRHSPETSFRTSAFLVIILALKIWAQLSMYGTSFTDYVSAHLGGSRGLLCSGPCFLLCCLPSWLLDVLSTISPKRCFPSGLPHADFLVRHVLFWLPPPLLAPCYIYYRRLGPFWLGLLSVADPIRLSYVTGSALFDCSDSRAVSNFIVH
jgi:hypothetical protein